MKLSDVLSKVMVEGERLGFDALDALGHPVAVYNINGERLGDVDQITIMHGEVRVELVPLKGAINGPTAADPSASGIIAP